MTATESTGLLGSDRKELTVGPFNIEKLRAFGLLMGMVMLFIGKGLTDNFVWGTRDNPVNIESTYIYGVFGFSHTCVFIDFNPSKTVSAILVILVVLPLMLFTVLNYYRIVLAAEQGKIKEDGFLIGFAKSTWFFRFVCFTYFFLVFVNSPDGEYDPNLETIGDRWANLAWRKYLAHYLPFMFWQLALALMAIEQTWYKSEIGNIPFGISCTTLKIYTFLVSVVFIYYTVYIWAHMFGFWVPGYDSVNWAVFIMFFYIVLTAIIPAVFALVEEPYYHQIDFFSVPAPED